MEHFLPPEPGAGGYCAITAMARAAMRQRASAALDGDIAQW